MHLFLQNSTINPSTNITITGSKSESNRLLLLKALFENLEIQNVSNSDDSQYMLKALDSENSTVDIHHAGTAMRFLTAYFATLEGQTTLLTGSQRMQERPIKILVDTLRALGADIEYDKEEGYPPLRITGKTLLKDEVRMKANVSSQYISALLLMATKLKNGLILHLEGKITSVPYIKMTLSLLDQLGVETSFEGQVIQVKPYLETVSKTFIVESDWSSASYFYSIVALSPVGTQINLSTYKKDSLQGDAVLQEIYTNLGVQTTFEGATINLKKINTKVPDSLNLDLANAPDIAQTIVVTCLGLQIKCKLTGLHTLKIKETDRLEALKNEIYKFGTSIDITDDSLHLSDFKPLISGAIVETYNDHRMAMAFAPLALKTSFSINEAEVVSKSFPDFWENLAELGFNSSKSQK
ncbi:3-phosphoshikimate 1-carboxyvinyltransferase [Flavobacteriaceae bacterium]|nr:3-phosphoshikimate 1-carboxyvinyltransferase [Flavobacteriaceae bacterium]MDA7724377.1 3-phosphoshikimate 1-carboxyvinyltransferase [Flavobacteriaceae bacterium]MDA7849184.1 3-phosphoshikimate 1-carboxyvinyltransferase [Flavobacteriaceae bacterium]MDB0003955.1 3-phosphoshikimate 1-carboxyvinyltransferase [Flavobacteriaceae bacterium]